MNQWCEVFGWTLTGPAGVWAPVHTRSVAAGEGSTERSTTGHAAALPCANPHQGARLFVFCLFDDSFVWVSVHPFIPSFAQPPIKPCIRTAIAQLV